MPGLHYAIHRFMREMALMAFAYSFYWRQLGISGGRDLKALTSKFKGGVGSLSFCPPTPLKLPGKDPNTKLLFESSRTFKTSKSNPN